MEHAKYIFQLLWATLEIKYITTTKSLFQPPFKQILIENRKIINGRIVSTIIQKNHLMVFHIERKWLPKDLHRYYESLYHKVSINSIIPPKLILYKPSIKVLNSRLRKQIETRGRM